MSNATASPGEQLSYQVVDFGQPLQLARRAIAAPQGSEVLVCICACGVCHSDLHMAEGFFDLGDGRHFGLEKVLKPPRTLGHEIVGTVAANGPDAEGALGRSVIVFPWIGCGQCALCARGDEHMCARPESLGTTRDGGFSTHVRVPHPRYLIDHAGIDAAFAATLACSGLTAYSALKKVAPATEQAPLVIIGAGGVGLSAVALAKAMHGLGPIVVDIDPAKRQAALDAGASRVVDPAEADAAKTLARSSAEGVSAVLDFVGSTRTFEFANAVVGKGGKILIVGLFGGSASIQLPLIPMRAISIGGSYVGSLAELRELVALAQQGVLPSLPLSSRPLGDVQAVLDELRAGKVTGRAILQS
ncbi:alcohol dehydrogenase [Comamonas piscis]